MENNIINQKTIRVLEKYKRENSKISIYLKELNGKTLMGYNEKMKVNSASCIKVPIMLAILRQVELKNITLADIINFEKYNLPDYEDIYSEKEKKASILELLTFMIINSDNLATNVLIDLFGFDYFNNFFKELNLNSTSLNRYMGIYNLNKENYTSNDDMYNTYKKIYNDEILNKDLCSIARNILHKQRGKKTSQRYIYQDIEVYHKTGGLEYLQLKNDCGYFKQNNKAYYFGYFAQGLKSKNEAEIMIGEMFEIFYKYILENNN